MVHDNQDPAAWKRLGQLMTKRRVTLGWFHRKAFVKAHKERLSNDRTIAALENNERMNFSEETLALVELVYRWKPGSIDAILAGGDPRPMEEGVVVVHDMPSASDQRMECRFIIDRLREDRLVEALHILRGLEAPEG